jgi:hypothetical protein
VSEQRTSSHADLDDPATYRDGTNRNQSLPVDAFDDSKQEGDAAATGQVRVFVIFDVEHDRDLYELLRGQSRNPGCGFGVTSGSERATVGEAWRERARRKIREADQIVVICGEHAEASTRIHTEFLISQEEEKAYILLWGRRGIMCTKPIGAKPADGMYSWTEQVLHDQIAFNQRKAGTQARARSLRKVTPNGPGLPRTGTSVT